MHDPNYPTAQDAAWAHGKARHTYAVVRSPLADDPYPWQVHMDGVALDAYTDRELATWYVSYMRERNA